MKVCHLYTNYWLQRIKFFDIMYMYQRHWLKIKIENSFSLNHLIVSSMSSVLFPRSIFATQTLLNYSFNEERHSLKHN